MVKFTFYLLVCAFSAVSGFGQQSLRRIDTKNFPERVSESASFSRYDFMGIATSLVGASVFISPEAAIARGRATLEYSYDRYVPRIVDGGVFYANDLKKAIANNDWKAIKVRFILLLS